MAHNLSTHTDAAGIKRDSFYSLREAGWHKLGQVVDKPLSDPDVIQAAGLNWTADKVALRRADTLAGVEGNVAIVRSDTQAVLGFVGPEYEAIQNTDLLAFFRDVAGSAEMTVETAGALGKGEIVWALAKIPGLVLAKGDDISQGYLAIRNNHDGNGACRVVPTLVRIVCQNTMRMAMGEAQGRRRKYGRNTLSGGYWVRHTSGAKQAMADIASAYAQTRADFAQTQADFSALTGAPLTSKAFDAICAAAFKATADAQAISEATGNERGSESERSKGMAKERQARIAAILQSPTCNVPGTAGTVWAALNAVTEYIDHEARTRVTDAAQTDAAQRFASSCFGGEGDKRKAAAYSAAMELVGAV